MQNQQAPELPSAFSSGVNSCTETEKKEAGSQLK